MSTLERSAILDEDALLEAFGQRLRARRMDLHLSQTQLAADVGISRPALANVEAGRRSPDLLTVIVIARHLGTSVGALVGEGEQLRVRDSDVVIDQAIDESLTVMRIELKRFLGSTIQQPLK